jgi:hypothetical protein
VQHVNNQADDQLLNMTMGLLFELLGMHALTAGFSSRYIVVRVPRTGASPSSMPSRVGT